MDRTKIEQSDLPNMVSDIESAMDKVGQAQPSFVNGADALIYVRHLGESAASHTSAFSSMLRHAISSEGSAELELRFVDHNTHDILMWINTKVQICARGDSGTLVNATFEDITVRKTIERLRKNRMMKEALDAANRDRSTGVYNKFFTEDIIRDRLAENDMQPCMLFILDIDSLKQINDTYGHPVGDKVIETVAYLLRRHVREGDVLGRIGGDEFMGLICGITDETAARELIERLLAAISGTTVCGFALSASVGCVMTKAGTEDFATLYSKADKVLYHVKRNGKSNYDFYDDDDN